MKTRISAAMLWIVALLFVAPSAQAQSSFEGRITMSFEVAQLGGEKLEAVANLKGEKLMLSMDMGPQGSMNIYSQEASKNMVLVAGPVGYQIDFANMPATPVVSENKPNFKASGKKETINGYSSEEWVADIGEGQQVAMWVTGDISKADLTAIKTVMKAIKNVQPGNNGDAEFTKRLDEKGQVPVRTVISVGGANALVIDIAKIEKASIEDSIFTIPSNITIQKLDPGMLEQGGGAAKDGN